jgi:hypothetical protein
MHADRIEVHAMLSNTMRAWGRLLSAMLVAICAGSGAIAQDAAWRVSKSSGEVWVTTSGAQPVALTGNATVKPGDTIRTGPNGRVLLVRGAETILISANSTMGISGEKKEGLSTVIVQQAGSILLEVEKRNVQHFEVATPYLAAVVKGTQFRVSITNNDSHVDVLRGQVQVTDYKTGQFALVNPGQVAKVLLQGSGGLSLRGSGALSPIQQGTPRSPSGAPVMNPNEGASTPKRAENGPPDRAPAAAPAPVPAPERNVQLLPSSPDRTSTKDGNSRDDGWAADIIEWGNGVLGLTGRKNRDDTLTLMIALPAAIGFSVAIGAGVLRRRRKPK